jgi:hypothetical protein
LRLGGLHEFAPSWLWEKPSGLLIEGQSNSIDWGKRPSRRDRTAVPGSTTFVSGCGSLDPQPVSNELCIPIFFTQPLESSGFHSFALRRSFRSPWNEQLIANTEAVFG